MQGASGLLSSAAAAARSTSPSGQSSAPPFGSRFSSWGNSRRASTTISSLSSASRARHPQGPSRLSVARSEQESVHPVVGTPPRRTRRTGHQGEVDEAQRLAHGQLRRWTPDTQPLDELSRGGRGRPPRISLGRRGLSIPRGRGVPGKIGHQLLTRRLVGRPIGDVRKRRDRMRHAFLRTLGQPPQAIRRSSRNAT